MMNKEVKLASEAQIALYNKIADMKVKVMEQEGVARIPAEELAVMTSKALSDKIAHLNTLKMVFTATANQKELIQRLCERAGLPLPPTLETMTSQQASGFIDKINAFLASKPALVTDKQKERISLYIEAGLIDKSKIDFTKLAKKDASEIIDTFEETYRQWRDSHVTDKQIEFIQSLQERLGDVVLTREELLVMSRETASQLIDQLNKEWVNRDNYAKQAIGNYKDLTDRSREFETKMKLTISQREFEEKHEMVDKLFVLIGQEPEGTETVSYDTIDDLLANMVSMARLYVDDETILTALGLNELADVLPVPAE